MENWIHNLHDRALAEDVENAASLIRAGQLVAFPTETVYGLGANALDEHAVNRIFEAKGRPATSPLIVHVHTLEMARQVVSEWPDAADRLARRFWPGPLTLVLPKHPKIPHRVTAGLDTVGVRIPYHPLALALIQAAGVPIAAPSANRFTELSPTTAEHVRRTLGDRVAMILDGGPAQVGIESTVLSLIGTNAVLLRPGMISQAEIEGVIGPLHPAATPVGGSHLSPGMHPQHYRPRTPLLLVDRLEDLPPGRGACLWIAHHFNCALAVNMPNEPAAYAAMLYSTLHRVDLQNFDWIAVERPPSGERWAGVQDRLRRAAKS